MNEPRIYPEHQGTGSPHADKKTGICWCLMHWPEPDKKRTVVYLKAGDEGAARAEAAPLAKVAAAELKLGDAFP
jgi:hypothetical protein